LTGSRLQSDRPAHAIDGLANNGQADAGAWILLRFMQFLKQAEDTLVMDGVNPDAVVFDEDAGAATNFRALPIRLVRT
jgi:hypothetical protein